MSDPENKIAMLQGVEAERDRLRQLHRECTDKQIVERNEYIARLTAELADCKQQLTDKYTPNATITRLAAELAERIDDSECKFCGRTITGRGTCGECFDDMGFDKAVSERDHWIKVSERQLLEISKVTAERDELAEAKEKHERELFDCGGINDAWAMEVDKLKAELVEAKEKISGLEQTEFDQRPGGWNE